MDSVFSLTEVHKPHSQQPTLSPLLSKNIDDNKQLLAGIRFELISLLLLRLHDASCAVVPRSQSPSYFGGRGGETARRPLWDTQQATEGVYDSFGGGGTAGSGWANFSCD